MHRSEDHAAGVQQSSASVVLLQIHARVEAGHLIGVAVEHQRLAASKNSPMRRSVAWLQRG